jgi:Ca2+-binding EF-hand superfamily protein
MGIRGSSLNDKINFKDLELQRFSLWRSPQFESMWRRFNDAGLSFALDIDKLGTVLATPGGIEPRSGPVNGGSTRVTGSSVEDPLLKLFPLFDTDHNGLIDAFEFMSTLAICSRMDRRATLTFICSLYDFNQNAMYTVDEITIMMRTVVYGVAKIDAHPQTVAVDTEEIESLASKCLKFTGVEEDAEVTFEQLYTYCTSESKIRRYMEYCEDLLCPAEDMRAGAQFSDTAWVPGGHSLYNEPLSPPLGDMLPDNIQWRRLPNLKSNTQTVVPVLFADDVQPSCACPGKFANEWFIAALNVLLAKPQIIKALFLSTGQEQSHGRYCVRFFKDGIVRRVIVDDLLPCTQLGTPLCSLAEGSTAQAWVPIVEKAYAKLHGTYEACSGGTIDYALRDLTGGNVERLQLSATEHDHLRKGGMEGVKNRVNMWEKLNKRMRHGFVAATRATGTVEQELKGDRTAVKLGLVLGHTYGVVNMYNAINAQGEHVRLVKIRLPPGSYTGKGLPTRGTNRRWVGAWSPTSREYRTEMHNKSDLAKNILLDGKHPWGEGKAEENKETEETEETKETEGKSDTNNEGVSDELMAEYDDADADADEGLMGDPNQRTFFMSFQDFCIHFTILRLVTLWDTGKWVRQTRTGSWTSQTAGGGLQQATWTRNPQYALEVFDEPADVFIELGQADPRFHLPKAIGQPTLTKEATDFMKSPQEPKYQHSLGILVVQHNFGSADPDENGGSGIARVRQFDRENVRACTFPFVQDRVVTLSFVANPGKYIIIPMHLKPQVTGEYSLRVLSESEFDLFGNDDATWEDPPR